MRDTSGKTHLRQALKPVVLLASIPVAVLWSWNIALPDLLGAPTMDYRNALGVVILGSVVAALGRGARDGLRHRSGCRAED